MMKKLPIGIQDIAKLFDEDCIYVDKTHYALELISSDAPHYFISRPRRFGKSLFVSTLEQIWMGNREIFKGCSIYDSGYDWKPHPTVHLDFSQIGNASPQALIHGIDEVLEEVACSYGLDLTGDSMEARLRRLLKGLADKTSNRVVVLIDEYDQPLINNLDDIAVAQANRKVVKNFYAVLKGADKHIAFTFVTGISKFSQVSLFSGPNYLRDITMDAKYAGVFGLTEDEVRQYFPAHVDDISKKREMTEEEVIAEVREWYNGYRFSKSEVSVYNPFSTLNYMSIQEPKSYWYRTGTPTFLTEQMKKFPRNIAPLSGTTASENALMDISSIDEIDLTALMYQAGYLTIRKHIGQDLYALGLPNKEVSKAFLESLVKSFAGVDSATAANYAESLNDYALDRFFTKIKALFASFPYHLFTNAREATYQGMLLALLKGMRLNADAESPTNRGRTDLSIDTKKAYYIIECKLDKTAGDALQQIESNKYYEKYLTQDKEICLIGLNFSSKDKNLSEWQGKVLASSGELIKNI